MIKYCNRCGKKKTDNGSIYCDKCLKELKKNAK